MGRIASPRALPGAARIFSAYGKAALGGCHGSALERLGFETAKAILAEVFHARPGEVEGMIQRRLEEKSWGDGGYDSCQLWNPSR
jgi:hypothetical protein